MRPRAFTLIELLVVVSIIALLTAILLPALNKARGQARIVACLSQMRQVGTVGIAYGLDHHLHDVFWRFENHTGDYPYESAHTRQPGNPARALHMANDRPQRYLTTGELFFCPTYELNYEDNYDPEPPSGSLKFWGTYTWHFRPLTKQHDTGSDESASNFIQNDNPSRSGNVVMVDTPALAYGAVPTFTWEPTEEHYNALFHDGHVETICTTAAAMGQFMWGPLGRPN